MTTEETGDTETPVPIAQVEEEVCRLAAQLAAGTARYLLLLAEFDARGGWGGAGILSCAHWMSWRLGVSLGTAREQLRVARALQHLPATAEEFGRGALSYSKVRAITRVATPETEVDLVQMGLTAPAAHLDRLVRGLITCADDAAADERRAQHRRSTGEAPPELTAVPVFGLTWSWTHDGTLTGSFRLDPEDGATFLALVRGAVHEVDRTDRGVDGPGPGDPSDPDGSAPPPPASVAPGPPGAAASAGAVDLAGASGAAGAAGGGVEPDGAARAGAPTRAAGGPGPAAGQFRWMTPRHVTPEVLRTVLDCAREGAAAALGPRRAATELVVHVDAALLSGEQIGDPDGRGEEGDGHDGSHDGAGREDGTRHDGSQHDADQPDADQPDRERQDHARRGGERRGGPHDGGGRRIGRGPSGVTASIADGPGLLRATVLRIGCDAAVRWALDGPAGTTLDQGRATRRPTRAQLRALQRRDGGCLAPGCGRRTFLHAHHVRHWAEGGTTDLDNLVLLCSTHHRLLHDGELDVRALGGQRFQVVDRRGRPLDPAPALTGDAVALLAAHADVPPEALTPDWLGEPLHDADATAALLSSWAHRTPRSADPDVVMTPPTAPPPPPVTPSTPSTPSRRTLPARSAGRTTGDRSMTTTATPRRRHPRTSPESRAPGASRAARAAEPAGPAPAPRAARPPGAERRGVGR